MICAGANFAGWLTLNNSGDRESTEQAWCRSRCLHLNWVATDGETLPDNLGLSFFSLSLSYSLRQWGLHTITHTNTLTNNKETKNILHTILMFTLAPTINIIFYSSAGNLRPTINDQDHFGYFYSHESLVLEFIPAFTWILSSCYSTCARNEFEFGEEVTSLDWISTLAWINIFPEQIVCQSRTSADGITP